MGRDTEVRNDLLLREYYSAKDDRRSQAQIFVTSTGLAIVLASAVVGFLMSADGTSSAMLVLGAPLALSGAAGYVLYAGTIASIRTFYARQLERSVYHRLGGLVPVDQESAPVPSSEAAVHVVAGATSGDWRFRSASLIVHASLLSALLGSYWLALRWVADHRSDEFLWCTSAVLGAFAFVIGTGTFTITVGGCALWVSVIEALPSDLAAPMLAAHANGDAPRSLGRYLIFPRPRAFALRLPLGLTGWLVGVVSIEQPLSQGWRTLLLTVLLVDLGAYQARYMVNDATGHHYDWLHPFRDARARPDLEDPFRRNVVRVAAAGRLLASFVALEAAGLLDRGATLARCLLVVIVALAVLYEILRRERARPLGPWSHVMVFVVASLTYGCRAVLFYSIAVSGDSPWPLPLVISGLLAVSGIGAYIVSTAWAAELAELHDRGLDALALDAKPHLRLLSRFLVQDAAAPGPSPYRLSWGAPWAVALFLGSGFSIVIVVAEGLSTGLGTPALTVMALTMAVVTALVATEPSTLRRAAIGLIGLGAEVALLWVASAGSEVQGALLVWAAVVLPYTLSLGMPYDRLVTTLQRPVVAARELANRVVIELGR